MAVCYAIWQARKGEAAITCNSVLQLDGIFEQLNEPKEYKLQNKSTCSIAILNLIMKVQARMHLLLNESYRQRAMSRDDEVSLLCCPVVLF